MPPDIADPGSPVSVTTPAAAARVYLQRGWSPIPIPPRCKAPTRRGWPDLRLTEADVPSVFADPALNIGVLLGAASGGLVDIDLDAPAAADLARRLLPPTPAVFGRDGKPASHRLYRADPVPDNLRLKAPDGGVLVELRATGCQTVFPPSIHPSGERIRWEGRGLPATVDGDALRQGVTHLAAACLLTRAWPAQGSRQDAALALAGGLLRGGWTADAAARFIQAVADAAGDEEAGKRATVVAGTAERLRLDQAAQGWPRLAALLGDGVVRAARPWLVGARGGESQESQGTQPREHESLESLESLAGGAGWSVVTVAHVQREFVAWLWPGRIPLGKLTILDGDPGLGKSALSLDIAARVTTNRAMPDGQPSDLPGAAGVLLLSAEDGVADTIRPRLEAARADLNRVVALTGDQLPTIPADLLHLRALIAERGIRLIIVDPLMAFLGTATNAHRDQDIRRALAPLARLAEDSGAAVVVIRHLNKMGGAHALYRGGGSIGIIGAARLGLLVARDPDDPTGARRVLAATKSNLGPLPPSLAFHPEPDGDTVRLHWDGVVPHTATSLLSEPSPAAPSPALADARDFLRGVLADGPRPAVDIQAAAERRGISRATLNRARSELGVRAKKAVTGWQLSLPTGQESQGTQGTHAHGVESLESLPAA